MSEYLFTCQYCGGREQSKLSAAHHTCDVNALRERIDGLLAHMEMWHTEAMRLAKNHNEDTFYHRVSKPVQKEAA